MKMKLLVFFAGVVGMASLASAAVVACSTQFGNNVATTAQLSGNDGCSVDGLTFSNFTVTSTPVGAAIFLSQSGTGVFGGEVDLGFQIVLSVTPPAIQDTILTYKVTGATMGVDISHNGNNTTIGEVVCDVAFGTLGAAANTCPTGHVVVNYSNPPVANGVDQLYINGPLHVASLSTVYILKDISVREGGFISSFVNSHAVPEPMTLSMMGIGLLGLGLARRRQMGKK